VEVGELLIVSKKMPAHNRLAFWGRQRLILPAWQGRVQALRLVLRLALRLVLRLALRLALRLQRGPWRQLRTSS
jgi:hypothetical protein